MVHIHQGERISICPCSARCFFRSWCLDVRREWELNEDGPELQTQLNDNTFIYLFDKDSPTEAEASGCMELVSV